MAVSEISKKDRIAVFFILNSFLLTVARGCVLPYIVVYIAAVFERDITISGIVLTVSSVAGIIISLYSGKLASLKNGYSVLLSLNLGFLFSLILISKTDKMLSFAMFLICLNLFYSCYEILLKVFFANQTNETYKRRYFSSNYLAVNVGWAIGPLLGALVQQTAMQAIFYLAALISIIPVIILIVSARTLSGLTFRPAERHNDAGIHSTGQNNNLPLIWLTMASFLGAFVYGNPIAYLSQFMIKMYSQETVSHIIALMMFVNAATVMIFQHFTVRLLSKKNLHLFIATGTACFILGLTLFFYAGDRIVIWCIGMFFFAFGEVIYVPALFIMTDYLAPPSSRGNYFSVQNLGATGAALSPLVMGFMFSALSGMSPFIMLAVGVLLSCFIITRVSLARSDVL
ncbi:MFS family permease [Erwinia toletana]|uniref:MFS family permease n=1 Tax=Winslowiella toletana TaxID=92490 RepID=A0ABS4PGF7_9GAMM|nr:MFS transporter [Winslowiella toletana]MBP2171705.1 MFS family permease [Winslowiella toletana]